MEKKTMGGFLAALRRASGMTQKELAEKLNVSDKSVSRWERDDGAPDLALLPVIAEVFGVTCDELLRGERAAGGGSEAPQASPKGEQQRRHLLASSLSRLRSRSCISLALSAAGFLIAMACNSALERALLGFFLGAVFFVASAAAETVQLNAALLAVHGEEGEDIAAFRRAVLRSAEWTYGAAWVFFACTLPLLWAFHPVTINGFTISRTSIGITLKPWQAALVLLAAAVIAFFAVRLVERRLVGKGFLPPPGEKTEAQRKNDRLLRTTALALCAALAVSAFIGRALVGFGDTRRLAEGVEFTDFTEFSKYMRKPVEPTYYGDAAPASEAVVSAPSYYVNDTAVYPLETIEGEDGEELCSYRWRNRSVVSFQLGPKADGYLPVTVYTQEAMAQARRKAKRINTVFCGVYAAEAIAAAAYYLRKREK